MLASVTRLLARPYCFQNFKGPLKEEMGRGNQKGGYSGRKVVEPNISAQDSVQREKVKYSGTKSVHLSKILPGQNVAVVKKEKIVKIY